MDEARVYTFNDLDKSSWGDGPWQTEPDKLWVDDATDLDCMIVRNRVGSLCGYVGVPREHPWHGQGYDDLEPYPEVHNPIGRPDDVWWLGFDTAHAHDLSPSMNRYGMNEYGVYRDLAYVRAEVTRLAQQAASAFPS